MYEYQNKKKRQPPSLHTHTHTHFPLRGILFRCNKFQQYISYQQNWFIVSIAMLNVQRRIYGKLVIRMQWNLARKLSVHDDVIKWKHIPRNWPFVRGIHRSQWIPHTRPVTQSFDVFFDLRLNKRLSRQPWGWWSETPSSSLWRHRNGFRRNAVTIHEHGAFQIGIVDK